MAHRASLQRPDQLAARCVELHRKDVALAGVLEAVQGTFRRNGHSSIRRLLVAMPGAPSSVLVSSKARSP